MAYIQPQLKIHQEFSAAQAAGASPLYACVIGPKYQLHRYASAGEKALLGAYDPSTALSGAYPLKTADGVVDKASVSVWLEDGRFEYYDGASFSVPSGVASGRNYLKSTLILRDTIGYSRASVLGTRDVAINDRVEVSWIDGVDAATRGSKTTRVMGFINEVEAAVEDVVAGSNAAAIVSGAIAVASNSIAAGAELTPSIVSGSVYSGLNSGHVSETYTVRVTKTGLTGVAEAMVISDSGTDDVANVVVDFASTNIGTRGVKLKLTIDTGTNLLTLGEEIVINARQTYAVPALTSNEIYSGQADTTYIVQCVLGGVVGVNTLLNPAPAYKVTTTNGVDALTTTQILAAGSFPVGNYGVAVTVVDGAMLCKGDSWTIKANSDTFGAVKTIVLADKLVDETNALIKCSTASTVNVSLGLKDSVQLPLSAYSITSSLVTVAGSLTFRASYLGVDQFFPVMSGNVYVDYREFMAGGANQVLSSSSEADVIASLGMVDASNPLALAVSKAVLNSGGTPVYYVQVASDDIDGYAAALEATTNTDEIYSLVPLTQDPEIKGIVAAHAASQSSPDKNSWRICWLSSSVGDQKPVYIKQAGLDVLATVIKPGGSEYADLLSSNGLFVTNGVAEGDIIRYNYQPSTSGVTTYTEGTVLTVVSEDELRISALDEDNFNDEIKIELWRSRSLASMAADIVSESASLGSRRVRNIWPDTIPTSGGDTVPGYFLCAALAGLRSGASPHAPLTNVSVAGFKPPTRTTMFSASLLNVIAESGTWIVTTSNAGGVFTRHQLTTDTTDLNMREDTVTCNIDSLSRWYRSSFSDLIGRGNVSSDMLDVIRMRIMSVSQSIMNVPYPAALGQQIQDYKIESLGIDPVLRDSVVVHLSVTTPYPLNNMDVYVTI